MEYCTVDLGPKMLGLSRNRRDQPDSAPARSKSTIRVQTCWNSARSSVRITRLIIRPSSAISATRAIELDLRVRNIRGKTSA